MIGRRSLILLFIASTFMRFVVGQDLLFFGRTSRTVLVDKQELDLNVFTGSLKDYEGRRGDFQIKIGGYTTYITGYPFDPAVKLSKEIGILAKFFHSVLKLSLRFDINNSSGRGGSITNVASITRITATNTSITYFGKDADGNDYSKEFKCSPKFEPVEGGKFIIFVGVKGNLPQNVELTSDLKSSDTTPSPTEDGISQRTMNILVYVCFPIGIFILLSSGCTSLVFAYWYIKKEEATFAKQEADAEAFEVATKKKVEAAAKEKANAKPKSPPKKKHRKKSSRSHDRDVEAQRDESYAETKKEIERKKKKKRPRIEDSVMAFNPHSKAQGFSKLSRVQSKYPKPDFSQAEFNRAQGNAPKSDFSQAELNRAQGNAPKSDFSQAELNRAQGNAPKPDFSQAELNRAQGNAPKPDFSQAEFNRAKNKDGGPVLEYLSSQFDE